MNRSVFSRISVAFLLLVGLYACNTPENQTITKPQEFEPAEETRQETKQTPIATENEAKSQETAPVAPAAKTGRLPLPSQAELKTVTSGQQAKRELSNDAMKAFSMKPEAFTEYMQSRIPFYKGKGSLKAENDMVRIQITENEMKVETVKGATTFPMQ